MRAVMFVFPLAVAACSFEGTGDDGIADPAGRFTSCADALDHGHTADGIYPLTGGGRAYDAYCNMTTAGGGWTLVLKADGAMPTFGFDSPQWTSELAFHAESPGHDWSEAKLASYAHVVADEVLIESEDGTLAIDVPGDQPLHRTMTSGTALPMPMTNATWSAVMDSDWLICAEVGGVNVQGSGYRARLGVIARDYSTRGGCEAEFSGVVGVGIAHPDDCWDGVAPPSSVGHVYDGCTVDDPFVYVYVR